METDKVLPAQLCQYDTNKHISENRADRAHVHKVRPCFLTGGTFETALSRFPNKEEVSKPKSQRSVFQKGFNMTYCNPGPIACVVKLNTTVTKSILDSMFACITDLTELGKNIDLDFQFCVIKIRNKNMTYTYKSDLTSTLNQPGFENVLSQKTKQATSEYWKAPTKPMSIMATSRLILQGEPCKPTVHDQYQKTLSLKIMSLDFNTCDATQFSKDPNNS